MSKKEDEVIYIDLEEFHHSFIEELTKCMNLANPSTSNEKLKELLEKIEPVIRSVRQIKISANHDKDESVANEMLGKQCILLALKYEILMWIYFKEGKPAEAWSALIDAEDNMAVAKRIPRCQLTCKELGRDYSVMEKMLFPKMMFQSPAFVRISVKAATRFGMNPATCFG